MGLGNAMKLVLFVLALLCAGWPARAEWQDWRRIGGTFAGDPTVASYGQTTRDGSEWLHVFARDRQGRLLGRWWDGRSWSEGGWQVQFASMASSPSCVSRVNRKIDCFARGQDDRLYQKHWSGSTWSGWYRLGDERLAGDPEAATWGPGFMAVFARSPAKNLMVRRYTAEGGWDRNGFDVRGGTLASDPGCTALERGRIECFARGLDDALWRKTWVDGDWQPWEKVGGLFRGKPTAASWQPGRVDVFVRGTNNTLMHRTLTIVENEWSAWADLGGALSSSPACVSRAPRLIDCFARGSDQALWQLSYVGSRAASEPEPVPGAGIEEKIRRLNEVIATAPDGLESSSDRTILTTLAQRALAYRNALIVHNALEIQLAEARHGLSLTPLDQGLTRQITDLERETALAETGLEAARSALSAYTDEIDRQNQDAIRTKIPNAVAIVRATL